MIGFSLNLFTLAIRGGFGFAKGSTMALDFTSGNRTLDPRVTFSRTTNATVTGPDGLIAYAPHNLLTFSEQFDNAVWAKGNATITANSVVAPNGTTTADTLTGDGVSAQHYVLQGAGTTGIRTISVYAKAGTHNFFQILTAGSANPVANFDLVNGTANMVGSGATASITSENNGWYRCVLSSPDATATNVYFALVTSLASGRFEANTISGSVYFWGAQLELGSTATAYNPTTVKNLLGFTENFDNAAWSKSNSFVQTNLLLRSEEFDNAVWTKVLANIVTANQITSPDGSLSADLLLKTATTLQAVRQFYTAATNLAVSESVYAKKGNTDYISFTDGSTVVLTVDLRDGTITRNTFFSSVVVQDVGNGWFRISYSQSVLAGSNSALYMWPTDKRNENSFTTISATASCYVWGAQLVQGTTPGDYKATYAAAAAVGYTDIYGQPFAQKLAESTATSTHNITVSAIVLNARLCLSAYVKASERMFALLGNPEHAISVNLSTGTATSAVGSPSAISCTDAGNGWFRIGFSAVFTSNGGFNIYTSSNGVWDSRSYTGDGTSGIYIFGAQLSDSASVDPYVYQPVAAPTSTAYYGPRFDYDPVTLAPKGLLIEEQRTNLVLYSEQFDNASWTKSNSTVTANAAVSPDGTVDADKLVEDTANSTHGISQLPSLTATTHTFTVYAKAAERDWIRVTCVDGVAFVNLSSGVFGIVSAGTVSFAAKSVTAVGNGWYRVEVSFTAASGANTVLVRLATSDGNHIYTGDGVSGAFLWGAQLEAGSFATSYIGTVASQVTRAADSASMIGNNFARWYTQGQGTLYGEASTFAYDVSRAMFEVGDGTLANRVTVSRSGTTTSAVGSVTTSSVSQASLSMANVFVSTLYGKASFAYTLNDFAASGNGSAAVTDTSGTVPVVDRAQIGATTTSQIHWNGTIKRIAYFNRRLSNTELQGITS